MDITKFIEKFNRIDGNIYTIEELVTPIDGTYEAELIHDNIELKTINVYTGPKLTGNKINTISFSTPSLTPWKTVIKIFSTISPLYISYETTGDQVEAEDINNLQDAINLTQEELNKENNRATSRENNIEKDLNSEITRAKNAESTENTRAINRENLIEKNLDLEVERAKASEKVLTDNLNTEINRAKGSEKTISDNLASEIDRAKGRENSIESNLNNYKTSNDSEIQGLKAKDIDLENKKANLDYVNLELNKRYTKDQTFTREEVLKKIQDLIGTAPDTLDTFKEIADALGNDPNFATTIMNELSSKVDKVTGKSLSTNDYDNTEKTKLSDVNAKKHEHSNKSIIDKITQGLLDAWNSAYSHTSDSIRHITSSERNLWNTVSDKANKIDIPNKLSQLTNDKKFITQDDIDTSQNHIHNNKSVLDKINQETLDDINLSADKVLKNKLTPIEINSTLTKLDNCAGGYVRNMQIKGRTLQNELGVGCINTIIKKGTNLVINRTLKPNTTYTFVSTIVDSSYSDDTNGLIWTLRINNIAQYNGFGIENKNLITKFTTGSEETIFGSIGMHDNNSNNSHATYSGMLLEGDWTNKELPSYFEGIKSVGELEGNKISILTKGKNLCSVPDGFTANIGPNKASGTDYYRVGNIPTGTRLKAYLTYKGNLVDVNGEVAVNFADKNKKSLGFEAFWKHPLTPIVKPNTYYIKIFWNERVGKEITFDNIIITVDDGTQSTPNLNYKEDKTEILLPSPHMGLPNGIGDIIDYDKNERIKNVDKMILDGTRGWTVTGVEKPNTIEFQYNFPIIARSSYLLSDKFIFRDADFLWNSDVEGITCNPTRNIQIKILKSKLETPDANGLKKYLQANPVTIYYQLDNPVTEKLSIKDTLQAFENGYIQLDNAITPVTQLEYSTNLPSILNGVVEIQDKILDRVNILEKKKSITWDELEGV
ncbi:hypothetical protein [Clostridium botulinum]|uniref:hypothetical protein n=1 Tax=Clostridium botulinum TaxID=1491 RepID=UPI001C9A46EE|nr:hypothetical protein [Clostridium botulinum]MBY6948936.1 hypothetical protein [Clostridium botulinum]MBY7022068.1 hypothetical protein [Clostridium botulinum]